MAQIGRGRVEKNTLQPVRVSKRTKKHLRNAKLLRYDCVLHSLIEAARLNYCREPRLRGRRLLSEAVIFLSEPIHQNMRTRAVTVPTCSSSAAKGAT